MSDLRLKSGTKFCPSGFPYTDPKTGFKADAYERGFDGAIAMLIQHRQANPKIYPAGEPQHFSPALVKQEFLRHLADKVPQIFAEAPAPSVVRTAAGVPEVCTCGGTEFEPHQCPTCGGSRIDGYRCKSCGKITGL